MTVRMKDVARRAGVSIATVSNVINRPELVAEGTVQRVRAVIADTGFVRNGSARQLRAGSSPVVSVLVPEISNPFFAELIRGVESRAAAEDLSVFVCTSHGDTDREERYLHSVLEQRPLGLILTPAGPLDGVLEVLDGRLPIVLVDRESSGDLCSVAVDDFRGGGVAVQHLAEQGHRRIAWVVGPDSIPQCAQRTAGVMYAAERLGVRIDRVEVETMTVADGRSAGSALARGRPPTAVVCANDLLALGVELALLGEGVGVPERTSIVGFDDIEFASAAAVTLTSVARPAAPLGATALEMLLDEQRATDHRHRQVQFQPTLQVRQSTAPPWRPAKGRAAATKRR